MLFHNSDLNFVHYFTRNDSHNLTPIHSKTVYFNKFRKLGLKNCSISNSILEPRQYKNDSIQSKIIPRLKLPRFFTHLYGQGKRAAISKLELFLTEWSRSYFVFALMSTRKPRQMWKFPFFLNLNMNSKPSRVFSSFFSKVPKTVKRNGGQMQVVSPLAGSNMGRIIIASKKIGISEEYGDEGW